MSYQIDWSTVLPWIPLLLSGLRTTLGLCLVAIAITMLVALPLALLRMSRFAPFKILATVLITVSRTVPLYIFLLWLFYGLPLFVGLDMAPVTAGIITLVVQFSAFQAEAYRSGLLVVPKGQKEAALAVGLTELQTFIHVVLPQALRVAVPPTVNNLISMFKATSVFAVIGVVEVTRLTQSLVGTTGRPLEFYTLLTLIYVAGVGLMSGGMSLYERSARLPHEAGGRPTGRPRFGRRAREGWSAAAPDPTPALETGGSARR